MAVPSGAGTTSTLKRAVQPVQRRSNVRAVVFLVIGAVAAISAAVLFKRYLDMRTAAARVPTAKVVVAAKDLAQAATLKPDDLAVVDWPLAAMPEGTVADPAELTDRVVVAVVVKGEPILKSKVASSDAGNGLAAILPDGMRAMAVRVDDVVGVAGFIHPGDSVDVIVTMSNTGSQYPTSKIVLQDIRVLAVGSQLPRKDQAPEKNIPATVATLLVDSEQSEKLALASTNGKILLTLRSSVDSEQIATRGITPPLLLASAAGESSPAAPSSPPSNAEATRKHGRPAVKRVAAPPPPAPPPEEKREVEILRGDLFEKRNFDSNRTHQ